MTRFGLGFQGKYRPTPAELADIAAGINGNDIYTKLLLRTTHNIYDASVPRKGNAVLVGGTTFITGAAAKFLGSSALFDGVDDYLYFADHADFDYSTSDFTIEAFIYLTGAPAVHHTIVSQNTDANFNKLFGFYAMADGSLVFELRNSSGAPANLVTAGSAPGTITNNVWTHVALVRSGSSWTAYKNGVAVATAVYAGVFPDFAATLCFGALQHAGWHLKGYIGEARISHIARWTETFTPPIGPYQYESIGGNDNFTKLLLHMNGSQGQTAWIDQSPYGVATPPTNLSIEHLTIAGGGGGGGGIYFASTAYSGGGGGAGGYTTGSVTLAPGNYNVLVGGGGAGGGIGTGENGYQGGDGGWSQFWTLPAAVGGGGGGGAGNINASPGQDGRYGGSGGGGGGGLAPGGPGAINYGGAPQAGQGNAGANGSFENPAWGGGGGGAGGGASVPNAGPGFVSNMNGTAVTFCQGGYAGYGSAGANYQGWGGNGGHDNVGGAGGIGTVIVRYLGAQKANGGSITQYSGYTAHTFYGSGTFTVLDTSQLTGNKGYATRFGNVQVVQSLLWFNGSSTFFDGAGDYLQYGDSPDWNVVNDWTLDARVRVSAYAVAGQTAAIAAQTTGWENHWMLHVNENGTPVFQMSINNATAVSAIGPSNLSLDTWYHIAVVRTANTLRLYVNGVGGAPVACTMAGDIAAPLVIGSWAGGAYFFNGAMSEFRISATARWLADFTPPRAPYGVQGNDGYTTALIHFDTAVPGAVGTIIDSSKAALATNSYLSIQEHATAKWGHSFYFPGNSWVQWPMTADQKLSGGDFTFDWWMYPTNDADHGVWAEYSDANNRVGFFRFAGGLGSFQVYIGGVMQVSINTATGVFPVNSYYHVAITRSGNNWTVYKDGIAVGSAVSSYVVPDLGGLWLGGGWYNSGQLYPYYGLIEEFRLSKKARWTTNFVPPQIPYFGAVGSINTNL